MDQIWWNHIIKAHAFLENVVKEAAGGHSLLLALPGFGTMEKYISGSDPGAASDGKPEK